MNQFKSVMLLAGLTALLLWIGQSLGGQSGLIMALLFAGLMNMGAYWFSDRIVLRMNGAQPVTSEEAPELYELVQDISLRAQIPTPKIYVIPVETPNAFATGRNPRHAAVAVTAGIMRRLNRDELRGVLAHEISHVKNRDTLIMTIVATIAGALSMLSHMAMWGGLSGGRSSDDEGGHPLAGLIGVLVAPFAAMLIQMAISRTREFMADQSGAELVSDPLSLARALIKIEHGSRTVPLPVGSPALAHLYIVNPFHGQSLAQLFSTHPSTADRVRRLEDMASQPGALIPR